MVGLLTDHNFLCGSLCLLCLFLCVILFLTRRFTEESGSNTEILKSNTIPEFYYFPKLHIAYCQVFIRLINLHNSPINPLQSQSIFSHLSYSHHPPLTTHNPQPTTHNPQPTTHNPQLTTTITPSSNFSPD